jgi:hypothetical protein
MFAACPCERTYTCALLSFTTRQGWPVFSVVPHVFPDYFT